MVLYGRMQLLKEKYSIVNRLFYYSKKVVDLTHFPLLLFLALISSTKPLFKSACTNRQYVLEYVLL